MATNTRHSDYEPENYHCRECKYYHNDCKRIDNAKVKFWKPWHQSDDRQSARIVCCDFDLKDYMKYAKQNWINFETYWKEYVENWLPYGNTERLVYFILNDDYSVRYGVKILDFIYGNMYSGDKLNAVEKMYYVQTRKGFGYKLIREEIEGVTVQ